MITAYCPGHITCVFEPHRNETDMMSSGSRGIGIRTAAGVTVEMVEVSGDSVGVVIDGKESDAPVTRLVLDAMLPDRGIEVNVKNDLPVGQGFGMSAAGAIAAALCAAQIAGTDERAAWEIAHCCEIDGGGGLGDVSGLYGLYDVPVRTRAGLPPVGEVCDSGIVFEKLSVAVLGKPIDTGQMLNSEERVRAISSAGIKALGEPLTDTASLFGISNRFSRETGIESDTVAHQISRLNEAGYHAAMCMLGNSIFSDCPVKKMAEMFPHAFVRETSSTCEIAKVTRSSRCV